MAIEIRELVIKTSLGEGDGGSAASGESEGGKEEIIQDCVDRVLAILKEKAER